LGWGNPLSSTKTNKIYHPCFAARRVAEAFAHSVASKDTRRVKTVVSCIGHLLRLTNAFGLLYAYSKHQDVHWVFVAKYRRLVFTKEILEDLPTIFSDIYQDFEATLEEFDGERDPVHLLSTYPPKIAITRLVNSLKGVSSRLIRKNHYPSIERALWGGSLWSPSDFAGSAEGAPLSINRQYTEQQRTPD